MKIFCIYLWNRWLIENHTTENTIVDQQPESTIVDQIFVATDRRDYIMGCSRILPAEPPTYPFSASRDHLYKEIFRSDFNQLHSNSAPINYLKTGFSPRITSNFASRNKCRCLFWICWKERSRWQQYFKGVVEQVSAEVILLHIFYWYWLKMLSWLIYSTSRLKKNIIPTISELLDLQADESLEFQGSLVAILHRHGINIRYKPRSCVASNNLRILRCGSEEFADGLERNDQGFAPWSDTTQQIRL